MWVLWGRGRHYGRRRGNFSLTVQSKWYRLRGWLTRWRGWWYYRVVRGTIRNRDLLGLLPIYPLTNVSYSFLDWSHGRSKLVNDNYLWVHISLIWSLVWLVWYSCQSTSNSNLRRRTQIGYGNYPTNTETLDRLQYKGDSIGTNWIVRKNIAQIYSIWYPSLITPERDYGEDNRTQLWPIQLWRSIDTPMCRDEILIGPRLTYKVKVAL